jgi:hypothetical protein
MDVEFHYYMTYLIAKRAMYSNEDALIIATSAQMVDDNVLLYRVYSDDGSTYENIISQTMDVTRPRKDWLDIYPYFHFFPGDQSYKNSWRIDGCKHCINTTPNSEKSQEMVREAFASENLYRIGIAMHVYADTWAHQNFIGTQDTFNALDWEKQKVPLALGHAEAGHDPDVPGFKWDDGRLANSSVNNTDRFIDAAKYMLEALLKNNNIRDVNYIVDEQLALENDLRKCIANGVGFEGRIAQYINLSANEKYGGEQIPIYDDYAWQMPAIGNDPLLYRLISKLPMIGDYLAQIFYKKALNTAWKKSSKEIDGLHWKKFQDAIKEHHICVHDILHRDDEEGFNFLHCYKNGHEGTWQKPE